jgi:hypothetical protein
VRDRINAGWQAVLGFIRSGELDGGQAKSAQRIVMTLLVAAGTLLLAVAAKVETFWVDHTSGHRAVLQEVFRLTKRGEMIMDFQGETVFRRRPFPCLLDATTREQIRLNRITDTIPERLMETRTCVAAADGKLWPERARAFLMRNYLPVGRLRVAGFFLTAPPVATDEARVFEVRIPASYVIVGENGPVAGTLDGEAMAGPMLLRAGRHQFRPAAPTGRLALFWAPALERGFSPFWK